jgi:hypothetical protein
MTANILVCVFISLIIAIIAGNAASYGEDPE